MSHKTCCSKYKRPKTVAQFAALCYPPNPGGHSDIKNRIRNPERNIKVDPVWKEQNQNAYKLRRGWWFQLDPAKQAHLLDGSGDAVSRGVVKGSKGWKAVGAAVVCFNACSLKKLTPPGATEPVDHGFTWNISLGDNMSAEDREKESITAPRPVPSSGWIPLDSIKLADDDAPSPKSRPAVMDSLENWRCCAERYRDWSKSLTAGKSILYKFRTVEQLQKEIKTLGSGKNLTRYFKEAKKGSVRKVLRKCNGSRKKLGEAVGIHPSCYSGNKLTDYLPKGIDFKGGRNDEGYTNLSTNVSFGKTKPRMAPIALDIFPARHDFHRLRFKGKKRVYGFIYAAPKRKGRLGKLIGRVEWYFGYCDVVSSDPKREQRRYGWVPSLAVRRVEPA